MSSATGSKTKLNSTEIIIAKALTDSYISYDELVLVNNVLKEYDMKEEIKNPKTSTVHQRFKFIYKIMLLHSLKHREKTDIKNPRVAKRNKPLGTNGPLDKK